MKADGSLKSLLQGVSQQPTRDRLPGQCTEQINMSSDPVRGLSRRPGDDLVGFLGSNLAVDWGVFRTKGGTDFIAKIFNGGVEIYDYSTQKYPVSIMGNPNYWTTPGKWSFVSIKGQTYLANNAITTAMSNEIKLYINQGPGSRTGAILQVLGGAYGKKYRISKDGVVIVEYTTPTGEEAQHVEAVQTTYIANVLYWLLLNSYTGNATGAGSYPDWFKKGDAYQGIWYYGSGALSSGWGVAVAQDILFIQAGSTSTPTLNISTSDDAGNINLKSMVDSVPDIADLPRYAPQAYVVRVAEATDPEEDLWFQFVTDADNDPGGGFGTSGAWYETVAPDLPISFDKGTMPRIMDFDGANFSISEAEWANRTVGTATTNPEPSFIGYGINDMANFQSRLVLLGGASLVGSRSKKYTNFWIGSASSLVDSDPVDLSSSAAEASNFRYCVPHNKDLVIFSEKGQFVLFGRTAATPSNAALVLTTSFEADLSAKPSPCGRNVFFGTKYGRYTGIREFYTEGGTDINDTRPTTQHVKEYLMGNVSLLTSTSNYDTLLVHTNADKQTVYPYQFIWSDNSKVQSAWSKWVFDEDIVFSFFDQEQLYVVTQNTEGYFLRRMSLDIIEEVGLDYPVHLSSKFDVHNVYDRFVLPYGWLHDKELIIIQTEGAPYPGLPVAVQSVDYSAEEQGYVVTLRNSMNGGSIVGGIDFTSEYDPTMPRVKDEAGDVVTNARLQINQFLISTEDTGSIGGRKISKWGDGPNVLFEGYVVNDIDSLVGRPAITDHVFKLPFKARADRAEIKLFSIQHWPMTLLDIEWEGTVNKRGRRIVSRDNT